MFYRDNWLVWSYDGNDYGIRQSINSVFDLRLYKTVNSVGSYKYELYRNAQEIRDLFSEPLGLLFSGGIDSEVILRIYRELKIPINVYIFRYENGINYRDCTQAISTCLNLGINYKIIDFNLQKFFENDAYSIWKTVYCSTSGWLPQMKFSDYIDDIPVFGAAEPHWVKTDDNFWNLQMDEDSKSWTLYHRMSGRTAICDWYEQSPEIILSHMNTPTMVDLLNNRIPGKLSSASSKYAIYKDLWPDIIPRPKLVGFEGAMDPGRKSKPKFMLEFEKTYLDDKTHPKYFHYSKKEILELLQLNTNL